MSPLTTGLWFDAEGEEAAQFCVSIFPNWRINNISYYGDAGPREAGTVLTVDFVLNDSPFLALNGRRSATSPRRRRSW